MNLRTELNITTTFIGGSPNKIKIHSCDVMCDAYLMYESQSVSVWFHYMQQMTMHVCCLPKYFFFFPNLSCDYVCVCINLEKKSRGFRHCMFACLHVCVCTCLCVCCNLVPLQNYFAQYYRALSPKFRI